MGTETEFCQPVSYKRSLLWVRVVVGVIVSLFVLGILSLIVSSFFTSQTADYIPSYMSSFARPVIVCHRGSRYMGPENTIFMHQWGLKVGCDVLEFDVRMTLDGELVVIHDATVNRTTNGVGPVITHKYEELRALDAAYYFTPTDPDNHTRKSPDDYPYRGLGHYIPLLRDFLAAFPDAGMNIEIKDNNLMAAELLWKELLKNPKSFGRTVVASSHCAALRHFRRLSQGRVATSACEFEVISFIIVHKIGIQNIWYWLYKPQNQIYQIPTSSSGIHVKDKSVIDAAEKLNQKVMYWVINDKEEAKNLTSFGASGIITDRVDLVYQAYYELDMVSPGFETLIEQYKSLVNTSQSFYIPEFNSQEIHSCVTLACTFIPPLIHYSSEILLGLAALAVVLISRMNTTLTAVNDNVTEIGISGPKKKLKTL